MRAHRINKTTTAAAVNFKSKRDGFSEFNNNTSSAHTHAFAGRLARLCSCFFAVKKSIRRQTFFANKKLQSNAKKMHGKTDLEVKIIPTDYGPFDVSSIITLTYREYIRCSFAIRLTLTSFSF